MRNKQANLAVHHTIRACTRTYTIQGQAREENFHVKLNAVRALLTFLTHAGWNSIIEGLARSVRLVLLPLMFDQGLNARHLTEKKISVEVPRDEEDGSFAPKDIAAALRRVVVEEECEVFGDKAKELASCLEITR